MCCKWVGIPMCKAQPLVVLQEEFSHSICQGYPARKKNGFAHSLKQAGVCRLHISSSVGFYSTIPLGRLLWLALDTFSENNQTWREENFKLSQCELRKNLIFAVQQRFLGCCWIHSSFAIANPRWLISGCYCLQRSTGMACSVWHWRMQTALLKKSWSSLRLASLMPWGSSLVMASELRYLAEAGHWDWLGKLLPGPVPEAKISFSSCLNVVFGFWSFRVSCRSFRVCLCKFQLFFTNKSFLSWIHTEINTGFYPTSASAPWHHVCANHVFNSARQNLNMASRTKHAFDIL